MQNAYIYSEFIILNATNPCGSTKWAEEYYEKINSNKLY